MLLSSHSIYRLHVWVVKHRIFLKVALTPNELRNLSARLGEPSWTCTRFSVSHHLILLPTEVIQNYTNSRTLLSRCSL